MPMIPDSPFIAFAYYVNNSTLAWKMQAFFIKQYMFVIDIQKDLCYSIKDKDGSVSLHRFL